MSEIESVLHESRRFQPTAEFQSKARLANELTSERMYRESLEDPAGFWSRVASELPWMQRWSQVLDWSDAPVARWFVGGKLNASQVCIDRHLEGPRADKTALLFEGEPGDVRSLTYSELHAEVCRFANVLRSRGVRKGDRVALYMPMIPEAVIAMHACARLGAAHSVVFAGFSAQALRERIEDGGCTAVITADGAWRRGSVLALKPQVDEAVEGLEAVSTVFVVRRTGQEVPWRSGRDVWVHELADGVPAECEPEPMDSEDVLFLLYTSGSTGKPKGIVHSTGGYMVGAYLSARYVFDLREDDVYWCTADVGSVSYTHIRAHET